MVVFPPFPSKIIVENLSNISTTLTKQSNNDGSKPFRLEFIYNKVDGNSSYFLFQKYTGSLCTVRHWPTTNRMDEMWEQGSAQKPENQYFQSD